MCACAICLTCPCAKVVHIVRGALALQAADSGRVSLGKVNHVQIVSHPCPVLRGVVVAMDCQILTLANSNLAGTGTQG